MTAPSTCGASSRNRCSDEASSGGMPVVTTFSRARSDLISSLGSLDIDDPISGQKFLTLGENAVGDGFAAFSGAHDPGLIGQRQAFRANQLAGVAERIAQALQEDGMSLDILVLPTGNSCI